MATDRTTGNDLDYLRAYLIEEAVEMYQASQISRRDMLRRVLMITGSIPVAASALLAAGCTPAPTTSPAAQPTTRPPTSPSPPSATASPSRAASSPSPSPARAVAPSPSPASPARVASPSPSPSPTRGAVTVSPTDPAIEVASVELPGQGVTVKGYRAQPRGVARAPGIIVIHQNRGVDEHIQDVTRRYAKDGFLALAVDLLSRRGGTESIDPGQRGGVTGQINMNDLVQDLVSGVAYLKTLPNFAGPKAGVVGYCFGGGMAWLLAVNSPDIGAANPYYGPSPQPIDEVQKISGPVLAFYGGNDQRINQGIPATEEAMRRYNKPFEYIIYPGAEHAFNDDTRPQAYNEAAARDAYRRSIEFFNRNLRG